MGIWSRTGLRTRLGLALAGVAVASVGLATVLTGWGLHSRLDQFASDRLQAAATHSAILAAGFYETDGRWSSEIGTQLTHLAQMNGYEIAAIDPAGRPVTLTSQLSQPQASAPVIVNGRRVGLVTVSPEDGQALTGEDRVLRARLDRLHLIAGGIAIVLGLIAASLLASALARPLGRLTSAARGIQGGDLRTRVEPGGAPEIREVANAFNRLAETLEHQERIRRDVSANVAHELRTPLAAIVSRIEAARDGVLSDEIANIGAMHTEALRLSRLVEDLGKLADAQQPGLTLRKEQVNLQELVHERCGIYREYADAKGIKLEEQLDPTSAYGDRGRIVQIVDNLLSNAVRYTDADGGTVTIKLTQRAGDALLVVADTGIGIKGEDLPYVFERFWRADRSRARRTGGGGIGLAIVRELVRAHNGRIDVESKPDQGSSFTVALPTRPPA